MTGDTIMHAIYLALLLGAVVLWFIAQGRAQLGKTLQYALVWGLIFMGVIAVAGLWEDIKGTVLPRTVARDGQIEIPRGQDGHFHVTAMVNDVPVSFLLDTGASDLVLAPKDAKRAGYDIENMPYFGTAQTANGPVRIGYVTLKSLAIGEIRDTDLSASVNQAEMGQSLMGMRYLARYRSINITATKMVLIR